MNKDLIGVGAIVLLALFLFWGYREYRSLSFRAEIYRQEIVKKDNILKEVKDNEKRLQNDVKLQSDQLRELQDQARKEDEWNKAASSEYHQWRAVSLPSDLVGRLQ